MKIKFRGLTVLFICVTIALVVLGSSALAADSKGRKEISAGDRALAMLEVQNVFSKHAFYHQAGLHCEEMDDIWVKENGEYGKTATWDTFGSIYEGIPLLREYYCTMNQNNKIKELEELSKIYPAVKNIPENLGAGHEYTLHTQETPVIEVAGDGKTAKGIWYSIGQSVRGTVKADGTSDVSTGWMWEKYAVDFAKEDGKWKIWHLLNVMDQGPVEAGGQGGRGAEAGGRQGTPAAGMQRGATETPAKEAEGMPQRKFIEAGVSAARPQPTRKDPNPAYTYNPLKPARISPRFPEPYYTFSETFSY